MLSITIVSNGAQKFTLQLWDLKSNLLWAHVSVKYVNGQQPKLVTIQSANNNTILANNHTILADFSTEF